MRALASVLALGAANLAYADHPSVDFGSGTSGPIATIPATTLPEGAAAFGARVQYMKSKSLPDEELRSRAGRHIHAHSADYLLSPSIAAGYGVSDDFTLALNLPYVWRASIRAGEHGHAGGAAVNTVTDHGDSAGLGDLTVLGKYRFAAHPDGLQAAALFGLKLPTGDTRNTDRQGERFGTEHQPGSGSWDPLLGAALTWPLRSARLDASVLYTFSTEGAQDTELGNRASYGVSLSYRIGGEDDHHGDGSSAPHHHSAWDAVLELNGEWEGKQRIAGVTDPDSGGNVLYLSPGVRFASSAGWSGVLSLGLPVAQDIGLSHPERDYRLIAGLSLAL